MTAETALEEISGLLTDYISGDTTEIRSLVRIAKVVYNYERSKA